MIVYRSRCSLDFLNFLSSVSIHIHILAGTMIQATRILSAFATLHDNGLDEDGDAVSLLYTAMPEILRKRMPAFPSLRKTASSYSRPATPHRSTSDTSETSHSLPPPYPGSNRTSISASDDDLLDFYSPASSQPQSSGNAEMNTRAVAQDGIDWKYAGQGQALLELSTREAHSAVPDAAFSRKLYIDSVQYLLNGLPSDLSVEEDIGLRAAIPAQLREASDTAETSVVVQTAAEEDALHLDRSSTRHSTLHQAVASITVHIFLAVAFVLPYIQLLLQQAYRYDREHKISDRVLAQGALTADVIAKQLLLIANSVYEMHDGKVGMAVRDVGLWWVHGVSGGVYEGVGEGMQVLGIRPATR